MTGFTYDISPRKLAKIAGIGYLIIIAAGIFAEFFVRGNMIVAGDAAATAKNIMASESLFRFGTAGDLIMLGCDVLLAWALYILLKPVNKSLALLAAFFRLVHAAIYGINLLNLIFVLMILGGAGFMTVFSPSQLDALAMLFLNAHGYGYVLGLVFFGFHCLVLGYLVYKSGSFPKLLGVLVTIAALGYLTDSFAQVLLSNYKAYASIFMVVVFVPAFIAELSMSLWLLFKSTSFPE